MIKALEEFNISRYRMSQETGIYQSVLRSWLSGVTPRGSNKNFDTLKEYYQGIISKNEKSN